MKTNAAKNKDDRKGNDPFLVPLNYKCKWVKEMLDLSVNEMAMALNISYKTLDNWMNDPNDTAAVENVRFDRLVRLIGAANGIIKPERLKHWIHHPQRELGDLIPVYLLGDETGFKKIYGVLENFRFGVLD